MNVTLPVLSAHGKRPDYKTGVFWLCRPEDEWSVRKAMMPSDEFFVHDDYEGPPVRIDNREEGQKAGL